VALVSNLKTKKKLLMTGAQIAIVVGICLLFLAWKQRHQIRVGGGRRNARNNVPSQAVRPQHPHLERKLLKLLGGNRNTANRLIQQSQLKHPEKSSDWHWEKAIYDLERDRWR
jgi:hypothetical protein